MAQIDVHSITAGCRMSLHVVLKILHSVTPIKHYNPHGSDGAWAMPVPVLMGKKPTTCTHHRGTCSQLMIYYAVTIKEQAQS